MFGLSTMPSVSFSRVMMFGDEAVGAGVSGASGLVSSGLCTSSFGLVCVVWFPDAIMPSNLRSASWKFVDTSY